MPHGKCTANTYADQNCILKTRAIANNYCPIALDISADQNLWKYSSQATCSIFWWARDVQWPSERLPKLPILLKSASCPLWPDHMAVRGEQINRCSLLCQGLWQGGHWDNPDEAEINGNAWEPWQVAAELPQCPSSVCSSEQKEISAQASTISGTTGVSLRALLFLILVGDIGKDIVTSFLFIFLTILEFAMQ